MEKDKDKNIKKYATNVRENIDDLKISVDYVNSRMDIIENKYKACKNFDEAIEYLNN